jgi:hypothetical protein
MKKLIIVGALFLAACGGQAQDQPTAEETASSIYAEDTDSTTATTKTDPAYANRDEVKVHGLGPYTADDPEFAWYDDQDGDGEVCER